MSWPAVRRCPGRVAGARGGLRRPRWQHGREVPYLCTDPSPPESVLSAPAVPRGLRVGARGVFRTGVGGVTFRAGPSASEPQRLEGRAGQPPAWVWAPSPPLPVRHLGSHPTAVSLAFLICGRGAHGDLLAARCGDPVRPRADPPAPGTWHLGQLHDHCPGSLLPGALSFRTPFHSEAGMPLLTMSVPQGALLPRAFCSLQSSSSQGHQ